MSTRTQHKFQKELNAGAISLVVLSVLRNSPRPLYGYEIAKLLQARGDTLPMNQAAIYPVLRSLEKQQLLTSEIRPSDAGPPRKYYRLQAAGQAACKEWELLWQRTKHFVDSILEDSHASATTQSDRPLPDGTGDCGQTA